MTKKLIVFVLILMVATISCSKKKEAKIQPQGSLTADKAVGTVEKIKDYYLSRDVNGIRKLTTPGGYRKIFLSMSDFSEATLTLTPIWIDVKSDYIEINASWKGTWKIHGQTFAEDGVTLFILRGDPPLLDDMHRDNPFIYPQY